MKATPLFLFFPVLLAACDAIPEDKQVLRDRYSGHYTGPCNAWVTSPVSGHTYCSSPTLGFSTADAYAAAAPKKADDGAFAGFDGKTPDEKKALLMAEGEKAYAANCAACHQPDGKGSGTNFPPLAGDPVANGGPVEQHVKVVLNGLSGQPINGVTYLGAMTPFGNLTDNQIAAIITFERNSWGNNGGVVEPAQVAALRGQ